MTIDKSPDESEKVLPQNKLSQIVFLLPQGCKTMGPQGASVHPERQCQVPQQCPRKVARARFLRFMSSPSSSHKVNCGLKRLPGSSQVSLQWSD